MTVKNLAFRSVSEAAAHFDIAGSKAGDRLREGWTPEQAFGVEPPPRTKREYKAYEEIDGRVLPPGGSVGEYKLYVISNLLNSKGYVGITLSCLKKRWCEHFSMGSNLVAYFSDSLKRQTEE